MNEKDFLSTNTGKLIWESNGAYYRFEPNLLPLSFQETPELSSQAQKTIASLARLDGLTLNFSKEEISLYQTPFMLKEAQLSSEIEGTRTTISDVFKEEKIKEPDPEKRLDNEEIRNYKAALMWALDYMPETFTQDYVKKMHALLLKGVRGSEKEPGQYKDMQNAIGKREDTFDSAKFVPASVQTTPYLMKNLIDYSNQETLSSLYKIGLIHYQFEAIHPFRDGNGRLGRMFVVLQLYKEKILQQPLLYISEYLTRNKDTYTELLYKVSAKGNVVEWLLFFLKGLEVQAKKSLELLKKIDDYKQVLHHNILVYSQSPKMHDLIDYLFQHPFFTVNDIKTILGISQAAAWGLAQRLIQANVAIELDTPGRQKVYCAYHIIDILEGRD